MQKNKGKVVGWLYHEIAGLPSVRVDWVPDEGLCIEGHLIGVGAVGSYCDAVASVFAVYCGPHYGLRLSAAAFRALRSRYCEPVRGGYTKGGLGHGRA